MIAALISALISPAGRWLAMAALLAAALAWGGAEHLARQNTALRLDAAQHALAQAEERIRNMEARHEEDDRAARDADPVGRLRSRWGAGD